MHAGDDQIHLLQDRVREVKRAVAENVHFDSGKNLDAIDLLVGGADMLDMLHRPLVIQSVGEGQVLGVVGNGYVFVTMLDGSLSHFLDGFPAVGFDGMHVDITLQISLRNKSGQGVFFRCVDFALVFPQLRWNVVELEFGVDILFSFSGNNFFLIQTRQTVFAQGVAHFQSALAEGNVVGLRSGEVLQGGAKGLRRKEADIHLHSTA